MVPCDGFNPRICFVRPPLKLETMRLLSATATIVTQFATGSRFIDVDEISGLCLVKTSFHGSLNLVSLCLGKLCVIFHAFSSNFGLREKPHRPPQLTLSPNRLSHTCKLNSRYNLHCTYDLNVMHFSPSNNLCLRATILPRRSFLLGIYGICIPCFFKFNTLACKFLM